MEFLICIGKFLLKEIVDFVKKVGNDEVFCCEFFVIVFVFGVIVVIVYFMFGMVVFV